MTTRFLLLMSVWALHFLSVEARGYDPASFPSYAGLPAAAKPLFAALARADIYHDEMVDLARVPEAESAMFELIQRILADPEGNPEFLHPVLRSTALRTDVSAAHQVWLRDLLRSKLGRTESYMEVMFKMYAPEILSKYPGPENEQLMIDYLKDKNVVDVAPGALDVGSSRIAMDFLGRSLGTARAIEPLREYAKVYQPTPGVKVYDYEDVLEAIKTIEGREKQHASATVSQTMGTVSNGTGNPSLKPGPETAEQPFSGTFTLTTIVGLAFLVFGGLTLRQWFKTRRE